MDPELLSVLRCPVNHEPLRIGSGTEIARLNAVLAKVDRKTEEEPVATSAEECLICDTCRLCFPIVDGVPILLPEEAIKW